MRRQFLGLGEEESDCPPASHYDDGSGSCVCNSRDDLMIGGRCKDKSTMCGAGTQWVDKDQACVPLTKYMSEAQIKAAIKAGVDLTGKGTPVVITTKPITVTASPPKSTFASLFGGANGMWLIGGAAVGIGLLSVMAKRAERTDYR